MTNVFVSTIISSLLAAQLILAGAPARAEVTAPCDQHLTFRWTFGTPIRTDVVHPGDVSLQNSPFLVDPEILSVTTGHNQFGPTITMKFGAGAAAVLAGETSTHIAHQLLIMLDDRVVSAVMVMSPVHDAAELNLPFDDDRFRRVADALKSKLTAGCKVSKS